jgi:uncharacterized membrane protein YjgN (DUF898 family)
MAMAIIVGVLTAVGGKTDGAPPMQKLVPILVVTYSVYAAMIAYVHSRITNLAWNSTRLGPLQFHCRIGARRILWIYASNTLAILASAGLLIPWASVRLARYRVSVFSIVASGDLQAFQGSGVSAVQAAGAEVGDLFDFDMSV